MIRVTCFESFSHLPESYAPLLAAAAKASFFHDRAWFEYLMQHGFQGRNELRIYALEDSASCEPLLVAPMRYTLADGAAPGARTLASIGHMENFSILCLMFDERVQDRAEALTALFRHWKKSSAREQPPCFDVLRVWPLEQNSEYADTIRRALRNTGFWVQSYANSFNRYEDTAGIAYQEYFAQRSANLRYSARRRQRALAKNTALEIRLYRDTADLEEGISDYVAVAKAGWQPRQSMISPSWLHLMRLTAEMGYLRLGVMRVDGIPAAAQFWIVSGGVANCVRLAYDQTYRKYAVGVVLTDHMIAQILDGDHAAQLDFGYGTEAYKAGWMKSSRHYVGYMAFNPATVRGLYHGVSHIAGRFLKRIAGDLIRRIAPRRRSEVQEDGQPG